MQNTSNDTNEFLSVKEFANLLGLHYNTVLRAIKSGRLAAVRIGVGKKATFRIARCEINRLAYSDLEKLVVSITKKRNL